MNNYAEFHLGKTITLSALSDLLTQISVERFQGFVRVTEAGEGRFVLSFGRLDGPDVALITLIRENPSQLYAEPSVAFLGDWVLEVYSSEIAGRVGALLSTPQNRMLHAPELRILPTFADWLLENPDASQSAEAHYARYASVIPLPLRGVVTFKDRFRR